MRRIPKVVGSRLLFWESLFAPTLALNLLPEALFDSRSVEVSDAVEGNRALSWSKICDPHPCLGGDAIVHEAETSR